MKPIFRTTRFDKDVKRMVKRGKSFTIFKAVITQLANDQPLEPKYRDHKLVANTSESESAILSLTGCFCTSVRQMH